MRWLSAITVAIGLAAAFVPAKATAAVAITARQVAAVVRQAGLPAGPEQVRFLSRVVSVEETPDLQAVRAELWGDTHVLVLMRCRSSAQCIPFYVALKWPSATAAALALRDCNLPSGLAGTAAPNPLLSDSRSPGGAVVIRRGEAATLVIEGRQMRVELPVICLQNGGIGAVIKVVSSDHKKTYVAEVVSSKLLKAGM